MLMCLILKRKPCLCVCAVKGRPVAHPHPQWQAHGALPQTLHLKEAAIVLETCNIPTLLPVHHEARGNVLLPISTIVISLTREQKIMYLMHRGCELSHQHIKH